MTAGQGGPQDGGQQGGIPGQGGPPPGWNAPPPGWNAPPQQPYGYAPAPPPRYGPPPTPLERPITVRAGLGAFLGSLVLSVISTVVTFLNWDTISAQLLARLRTDLGPDGDAALSGAQAGARIGVVFALVLAAVYGVFVWFAWRGQNWARVVLWVLGGLGLFGGVIGLAMGGSPLPFLTGLSFFQTLLLLAAIVLLALKPSNEWFRYRRWLRATGQAR
ncbi:MAG: hypothetical protein ACXVXT_06400 [Blastococcus sp.]